MPDCFWTTSLPLQPPGPTPDFLNFPSAPVGVKAPALYEGCFYTLRCNFTNISVLLTLRRTMVYREVSDAAGEEEEEEIDEERYADLDYSREAALQNPWAAGAFP